MINSVVSNSPAVELGLVKLIDRDIEEHGHCTIRDKKVLGLLFGITDTCETKMRRLRLFACQHDWTVISRSGSIAVFTRNLKRLTSI